MTSGEAGARGGDAAGVGGAVGAGGAGGAGVICQHQAPSGIGVPVGTVATASASSDAQDAPQYAIDGDIVDEWSSGAVSGWITLTFPSPTQIAAVRIHADAMPVDNEVFAVSTSANPTPLGSATATVMLAPVGTILPDIEIPPGLYSDLTVAVTAGPSWVGINEIWLFSQPTTCP